MQLTIGSTRDCVFGLVVLMGVKSMPWLASDLKTLWELHAATSAVLSIPLDWHRLALHRLAREDSGECATLRAIHIKGLGPISKAGLSVSLMTFILDDILEHKQGLLVIVSVLN
jgi:hypothetical protein